MAAVAPGPPHYITQDRGRKMKKIRNIYQNIVSKENLYSAAYSAAKGKRYRDKVADFNFHIEEEIDNLHKDLLRKTYRHGKYRLFTVYEPKERKIAAAPFRDRVVHHAVHDCLEPLIDKTFIHHSYACRKDKGTHKAVDKAQEYLRANRFCFHGDIKKYFPSIDRNILKGMLKMRIEDKELLRLLDEIIDSAKQLTPMVKDNAGSLLPGSIETSRSPLFNNQEKGLPIGNLTSQFFANLYLNELDYFVKFDLKERYYLRYMDDFLIFSNDRKGLLEIREKIRIFLKDRLELILHDSKSQVYKTGNGIKFLGFRIFKSYRRLTLDNMRRFRERLKRFTCLFKNGKMEGREICDSVRCWVAHSKYAGTKILRYNIWRSLAEKQSILGNLLKDILLDAPCLLVQGEKIK